MWFPQTLTALLSWPVAAVIIAIAYKPELLEFIPRFLKSKFKFKLPGGFELEADPIEVQKNASDAAKSEAADGEIKLKEIPGLSRTQAITRVELLIHSQIKNITVGSEPVDVLVRNLAQARLEASFGLIYAGIFGSQIAALAHLQAIRKVSNDQANNYYLQFEQKYPEIYAGYGFAGWLGFLRDRGLIEQITPTEVAITPVGDDFLEWLRATKLSINKPW